MVGGPQHPRPLGQAPRGVRHRAVELGRGVVPDRQRRAVRGHQNTNPCAQLNLLASFFSHITLVLPSAPRECAIERSSWDVVQYLVRTNGAPSGACCRCACVCAAFVYFRKCRPGGPLPILHPFLSELTPSNRSSLGSDQALYSRCAIRPANPLLPEGACSIIKARRRKHRLRFCTPPSCLSPSPRQNTPPPPTSGFRGPPARQPSAPTTAIAT